MNAAMFGVLHVIVDDSASYVMGLDEGYFTTTMNDWTAVWLEIAPPTTYGRIITTSFAH